MTPVNAPQTSTSNLPSDIGLCEACGAKNSLHATRCHKCVETLPWEKARAQKKERAAQTKAAVKSQVAAKTAVVGSNAGELFKVGLINFLVFGFCSAAPLLGYFLWKHFDNEASDYAGAAFWGWIIGGILHLARFLVPFIGAMAKVGAS